MLNTGNNTHFACYFSHVTFPCYFPTAPTFPSLSHPSHLRCSQLSRLREEFVRLTFLTARAFSAHFLSILYLYFSTCLPHPVCGIYTFFDARRSIVKSFCRDCIAAMIVTMLVGDPIAYFDVDLFPFVRHIGMCSMMIGSSYPVFRADCIILDIIRDASYPSAHFVNPPSFRLCPL